MSIAVISFSEINVDSRVLKQINTLSKYYTVYSIGYGISPKNVSSHLSVKCRPSGYKLIRSVLMLIFRKYDLFYRLWFDLESVELFLSKNNIKVLILNDATSWPIASRNTKIKTILDAHEFTPSEFSDQLFWRLLIKPFKEWCINFAKYGDIRFSVEPNLCLLWEKYSGFPFTLLPNSAPYVPLKKHNTFASQKMRVIHHGLAHPSRKIEHMINAIGLAGPRFEGYFILTGKNKRYINYLKKIAQKCNCHVLRPVEQSKLIQESSKYDIAILSIYPSNLNYEYCLPNKFYQFIQANLPIVAGPTPSISNLIHEHRIGVVSEDFSPASLSDALCSMRPSFTQKIQENLDDAKKLLCWENDQMILVNAVREFCIK